MSDLLTYQAFICPVATAILIYRNRVLLVKHKKLGIWLAPGGHIDDNELPHQAAEREFFEETGVQVTAVNHLPVIKSRASTYYPVPVFSNLHWVSQDNYRARLKSSNPSRRFTTALWPRGCEQHFNLIYAVKPVGPLKLRHDPRESTGIGWFSKSAVSTLDTTEDIKTELSQAFELVGQTGNGQPAKR